MINRVAVAYLVLAGVQFLAGEVEIEAVARAGQRVLFTVRTKLFRHLQTLSLDFYERERTGRLVARMTADIDAMSDLVTDGLVTLVTGIVTMFGVAVILMVMDWTAGPGHPGRRPDRRPRFWRRWSADAYRRSGRPTAWSPSSSRSRWPGCGRSSRSAASEPPPPAWPRPTRRAGRPLAHHRAGLVLLPGHRVPGHGRHRGRLSASAASGCSPATSTSASWPRSSSTSGACSTRCSSSPSCTTASSRPPRGRAGRDRPGRAAVGPRGLRPRPPPGPARRRPARGRLLRLRPGIRDSCTTSTCRVEAGATLALIGPTGAASRPWPS